MAVALVSSRIANIAPTFSTHPIVDFAPSVDGSASGSPTVVFAPQGTGWPAFGPTMGTVRLAVIAVQFADISPKRSINQIKQDYFGADHSVAAYYREVSYGRLNVTGDVFGWYTLPHIEAYYGTDCRGIDDGDCSGQDQSFHLAQDAVALAKNDVDFTRYDYFTFVHSGNGEESSKVSDDVWSVTYVSGDDIQTSSRTLTGYSIVAETEFEGSPLGVHCAEFGHLLGLPDMFNTLTGKTEMGPWELEEMGTWNGHPRGSSPAQISSWGRLKLGWLPASAETTLTASDPAFVTLNPLEQPGNGIAAVKIEDSEDQYYLVEVRQPIGFDRALPTFGVVAYTISNDPNAPFKKVASLTEAFSAGYLYQETERSSVDFKVFAGFANGTYMVGFGPDSFIRTNMLTINFSPVIGAVNTTVLVNGQTYASSGNGTLTVFDYSGNQTGFNVTIPDTISVMPGVREEFTNWSTGSTSNRLVLSGGNSTLTANYQVQYYVSVNSLYGTSAGAGWYDDGSSVTISVTSPVNATQQGARYTFAGWSGDYYSTDDPMSLQVSQPLNVTATWQAQFYLNVDTGGHAQSKGSGWYNEDATANFTLTPPEPHNGTWYIFEGWNGDYSGSALTGTVNMTQPMTLTANWLTLEWVSIQFLDSNQNTVAPTRISNATLIAPNGTEVNLKLTPTGQWLPQGNYHVANVQVFGINVSNNQSFPATANGTPKILLALFPLTFNARDIITTYPLSNVNVTITLPDGTDASVLTDQGGRATFDQLPAAEYQYTISGGWALQCGGTAHVATEAATINVPLVFLPTLTMILVGSVVAAALIIKLKRFGTKDERQRRNERRNRYVTVKMGYQSNTTCCTSLSEARPRSISKRSSDYELS
jgi:M6 family metalloprotease-like protein